MIEVKRQKSKGKSKAQSLKTLLLPFTFLFFTFLCGCQNQQLYKESRIAMGTFIEVLSPYKEAAPIAFEEIKRIEGLLSKYDPASEVSRLNKSGELSVSTETFYIINKAKEFSAISNGAFDITIGALMDLWGFTNKEFSLPQKREVEKTLKLVGSDKIIIDNSKNVIKFSIPGMKIDLGAIAKGYAVDCAVKRLKEKGIKSCLINAGGDIYCLGDKFGIPWNVTVQDPRNAGVSEYLALKDRAVATSGDYEQYFIKNKKRYSHIFNPKTGYPAESGVISVTVIAPDCLTADALATSIFVLGKEKGQQLANKFPGVEVKIIEENQLLK